MFGSMPLPLNYLLQHRRWRRLVQIGGEGGPCHAGRCCRYVCVYPLKPAGGGGVSWPGWDGGLTPRLPSRSLPRPEEAADGEGISHNCVREASFGGEYLCGQRTVISQTATSAWGVKAAKPLPKPPPTTGNLCACFLPTTNHGCP